MRVVAERWVIGLALVGACGKGGGGSATEGTGGEMTAGATEPTGGDPVCTDCTPQGPMTYRLPSPAGSVSPGPTPSTTRRATTTPSRHEPRAVSART